MSKNQFAQRRNSRQILKNFTMVLLFVLCIPIPTIMAETPDIMLAKVYNRHDDATMFWVSEKLDGVRARWDGKHLISRGGKIFKSPIWFVQGFPDISLDGELWMGRGQYEDVVSVVRRQIPHDGWKTVKFMVFDLPGHGGIFTQRVATMKAMARTPYLQIIEQFQVNSNKELMDKLDEIMTKGGEGLMLHRETALYHSGRSDDLLKLKPFEDAEAVVVGYKPGQGKNTGLMGSIKVRMDNGKLFYIGSGFTQEQRRNPPEIGSLVTYRYQGFTQSGIPRFAVFLRLRDED